MLKRKRTIVLTVCLLFAISFLAGCGGSSAEKSDTGRTEENSGKGVEGIDIGGEDIDNYGNSGANDTNAAGNVGNSTSAGNGNKGGNGKATITTQKPPKDGTDDITKNTHTTGGKPYPNLGGATIRINYNGYNPTYTRNSQMGQLYLKRVADIEKTMNCKIKLGNVNWETVFTKMAAGDPTCEIIATNGPYYLDTWFTKNLLYPLDGLGIDFSHEQFDASVTKIMNYKGKQYGLGYLPMGSNRIKYNRFTLVNTTVLKSMGYTMDDLYALQDSGKWTWDTFKDFCKKAKVTSANGTVTRYGVLFYGPDVVGSMAETNNAQIVTGTNNFKVNFDDPKVAKTYSFVQELYRDKLAAPVGTAIESFKQGKMLFFGDAYGWVFDNPIGVLGMKDYAVMYMPKGPDASDYVSPVDFFEAFCIVRAAVGSDTAKAEKLAAVLDAYCAPYIDPAKENQIYNIQLNSICNDATSKKIIMGANKYTVQSNYQKFRGLGGFKFDEVFYTLVNNGGTADVTSTLKSYKTSLQQAIDDIWK